MHDTVFENFGMTVLVPAEAKQLAMAALIGLFIGIERAWRHKVASLRTFSMLSAGSCLFAIVSVKGSHDVVAVHDTTRIAAQIVAGVGFLGGGVIFKTANRVEGITTAAMIWLTAAIGVACGFNLIELAVWSYVIWFSLNFGSITLHRMIDKLQGRKPMGPRIESEKV